METLKVDAGSNTTWRERELDFSDYKRQEGGLSREVSTASVVHFRAFADLRVTCILHLDEGR